jgi:hypothetical protein
MRYTKAMNYHVSATSAPVISTQSLVASYACAGVFTVILLAQLFDYDGLLEALGGAGFTAAPIIAAASTISLLLALPFLLRMYLSFLMRVMSAAAGWIVILLWGSIALMTSDGLNTGLLGDIVSMRPFTVLVIMGVLACVLAFICTGHARKSAT